MEQQSSNGMSAILLTSRDGTVLANGLAPSLPESYNAAINKNGVAIAPISGSCGTAVYRRERVIVSDIATDPLYDDTGSVYAVCGISTDITQRKQAEQSLQESEAKFRQLAENLDDVVWIADANHQTLYVSPVYEKIWGRSCEDLYRDKSV